MVRSLHAAVHELEEAWNELETWRHQTSLPAEEGLLKAMQRFDQQKMPDLQVLSFCARQQMMAACS